MGAEFRRENRGKKKHTHNDQPGHGGFVPPQLAELIEKRVPVLRIFSDLFFIHATH
jgi:hypothetical protein